MGTVNVSQNFLVGLKGMKMRHQPLWSFAITLTLCTISAASPSVQYRGKRSGSPRFIDPDDVCIFDHDCDGISYCRGFRCELTWWFILIIVVLALLLLGLIIFCVSYCMGYCR